MKYKRKLVPLLKEIRYTFTHYRYEYYWHLEREPVSTIRCRSIVLTVYKVSNCCSLYAMMMIAISNISILVDRCSPPYPIRYPNMLIKYNDALITNGLEVGDFICLLVERTRSGARVSQDLNGRRALEFGQQERLEARRVRMHRVEHVVHLTARGQQRRRGARFGAARSELNLYARHKIQSIILVHTIINIVLTYEVYSYTRILYCKKR